MLKANYGDFVPAALLGRQNPAMAGNDVVVSVSQDRDNEVERLQATAGLAHLTRRVNAGIVRIGPALLIGTYFTDKPRTGSITYRSCESAPGGRRGRRLFGPQRLVSPVR